MAATTPCTIPFGADTYAFYVSSDICDAASYPDMPYNVVRSPIMHTYPALSIPVVLLYPYHTNVDDDLSGAAATIAMIITNTLTIWYMADALLNQPWASILAMFFIAKDSMQPMAIATI